MTARIVAGGAAASAYAAGVVAVGCVAVVVVSVAAVGGGIGLPGVVWVLSWGIGWGKIEGSVGRGGPCRPTWGIGVGV